MQNDLVRKAAGLMSEQSAAYKQLEMATQHLSAALVRGEPGNIEALTKAGESELLRMRARLLEITSALTNFAEMRQTQAEKIPLEREVREQFDLAAQNLLTAARSFRKISSQTATLAHGGSSFTNACIQMCGVPPMTYGKPVLRYSEAGK